MAVEVDTPRQAGAGLGITPLLAVAETVTRGLGLLRQSEAAIEEMLRRDDELRLGTQTVWTQQLRAHLLELLDPSTGRAVSVGLGHPAGPAEFPFMSVTGAGGGENPGELSAGDEHHRAYTIVNKVADPPTMGRQTDPSSVALDEDDHLCIRHMVTGTGMQTRAQVACWTVSAERSEVLLSAARWALWVGRGLLNERGIHEYTWSEGGMEPSPDLEPRVTWLPVLDLTLSWTWRRTRSELVPNRVTIAGGSFGT